MCSLCTALCSYPVLALLDFTKPFSMESYASDTAVDGAHTQEHASVHKPINFLSKTLTSSECNYSIYNQLLAIVACCKAWQSHINGH